MILLGSIDLSSLITQVLAIDDFRRDHGVRKPWLLSVRESLHSWCKRVKERSKHSHATRSVCSLDTTVDERDEITVASGTLSRSSSLDSLHQVTVASMEQPDTVLETTDPPQHEYSFRVAEYLADSVSISTPRPTTGEIDDDAINGEEEKVDTLLELFQKT